MTIYTAHNGLLGGSGDILLEVGTENFDNAFPPSAPQCSVGFVGGPAVKFDFTVAGADAHIATAQSTTLATSNVVYLEVYAMTLGAETALISNPGLGYRPLRLRPDGTIAVYDQLGNFLGASTTSAYRAFRRLVLVEDGTGPERTVHLFVNEVEEVFAISPNRVLGMVGAVRGQNGWGWGDRLAAGQSTGMVYYLRNALLRGFYGESDSPRLVRWPALRVAARRMPTAEGDIAQWANGTTPSPNTWQDVDEFPNDGDTTRIVDAQSPPAKYHFFRSADSNPLPAGANVLGVQLYSSGRVLQSGKSPGNFAVMLSGQILNAPIMSAGTDYRGFGRIFLTRPDGTAWTRADFDPGVFQFGLRSDGLADPPGSACSNICYQVIYWTDLLPLATNPWPPAQAPARAQVLIV